MPIEQSTGPSVRRIVACAFMLTAVATAPADEIEVMVLGTYHLANPGQDLHNVEVDDVTTTDRQRQLEALADALAAFER